MMALSHGTASRPAVPAVPLVLGGDVVASVSACWRQIAAEVDELVALQLLPDTVKSPSQTS